MTHQEYRERLEEILETRDKVIAELNSSYEKNKLGWRVDDGSAEQDLYVRARGVKLQAEQAIDRLFLDVVGDDDAYGEFCSECSDWDDGRNDLRQQIRNTITGKEGGE